MTPAPVIDYSRDIRPIFSDNCYECHGPDAAVRKAHLRLDRREDVVAALPNGVVPIVPGDADASVLIHRVTATDPTDRMPPAIGDHTALSATQIDLLRTWINQGAHWATHWSFIKPTRPPVPQTHGSSVVRNPIDSFILTRLEGDMLRQSPEADRATLLRRITLDLTGLPPTPIDVDAFVSDKIPGAYTRVITRLMRSPRFGEHMARYWLDAARYGDTHGLHLDNDRSMWPWRDWVIDAFNSNMPFDQFTIEQLAGDLIPEPTLEQRIATGFNRNNVSTSEGGAIDAEYLVKYAADRVETTATVWMGLTMACAQCHDHKFDPISQKEYYEFFAFFNNTTENAMDGNRSDPPPVVRVARGEQRNILESLEAELQTQLARIEAPDPLIDSAQREWESRWRSLWAAQWQALEVSSATSRGGATLTTLEDGSTLASGENPAKDVYTFVARTDATDISLLRLEALTHPDLPHTGPGRAVNANMVLSEIEATAVSVLDPARRQVIRFATASADHQQMNGPFLVTMAIDGLIDDTNGWAIEGFNRREDRTAVFAAAEPFGFAGGTELTVRLRFETIHAQHTIGRTRLSIAGSGEMNEVFAGASMSEWQVAGPFAAESGQIAHDTAYGPEQNLDAISLNDSWADGDDTLSWRAEPAFHNGVLHMLPGDIAATYLYRTVTSPTARSMDLSLGSDDAIKVWLNGARVHDNYVPRGVAADQDRITIDLQAGDNHLLMKITNLGGGYGFYFKPTDEGHGSDLLRIVNLLALDEQARTPDTETAIANFYRRHYSPDLRPVFEHADDLRRRQTELQAALPITLVMNENPMRRQTYILNRGQYDDPRDPVSATTPQCLPPITPRDTEYADRLDMARWLVRDDHPLTARVIVNRLWQQVFGTGIVETVSDFGSQGQWPSHPELLDWLAVEFIESGWDVRHMMRLMLTSATYRQSAAVTPELLTIDPDNRLLARGPRFRLDAEVIRDQALAASGLLVEQIGGPGVRPYQPEGLWKAVAYPDSNTQVFMADGGDAQYRRSMYTYWKRTSPPPNMTAFDAPDRETCTVRRPRTNTPLQMLVLLNDRQFVEAARVLAQRAMLESGNEPARQVTRAFRLLLAREPNQAELDVLLQLRQRMIDRYTADPSSAEQLLSVGDAPRDVPLDPIVHAAMTNVVSALLGLDETVTKG